jgi:phage gp29-like protein
MADKNKVKKPNIEVFNITVAQVDRSYKGIDEWRTALKAAESITSPRRKQLYDLYDEIMLDPHLTSITEKRLMRVTNTTIKFFDSKGKEHEEINKLIETEAFENMLKDILDCRFQGYSLLWFKDITPEKIDYKLINRRHVRPESTEVVNEIYDDSGIDYTDPLYSRFVLTAGKPKDLGLLIKAAVSVIYKKGDVADWSVFAQIFGTPFREYTYEGNDPATKTMLEQVAKNTTSAPYAIMPSNANVKTHDSVSKSGSSQLYKHLAEFCDGQNSKLILHNTMTTDAKGGNYKGEIHAQSEQEVTKADKKLAIRILNEKFKPILENFGFKVEGGHFAYEEKEQLTLKQRLELDKELAEIIDIDDEYFYETYNIPQPKNKKKIRDKDEESTEKKEPKSVKEKPKKEEEKTDTKLSAQKPWYIDFKDFLFSLSPWA